MKYIGTRIEKHVYLIEADSDDEAIELLSKSAGLKINTDAIAVYDHEEDAELYKRDPRTDEPIGDNLVFVVADTLQERAAVPPSEDV